VLCVEFYGKHVERINKKIKLRHFHLDCR
jgi:hypothetical protein